MWHQLVDREVGYLVGCTPPHPSLYLAVPYIKAKHNDVRYSTLLS